MKQMMEGEITTNHPDSGNINKIRFYVCPSCGNILVSTGSASIFCCGRKLDQLKLSTKESIPPIEVEQIDMDYYVSIDHPMDKEHYISFAAYVKSDLVILHRLYPEQSAALRVPLIRGGKLYIYCTKHGLMLSPVTFH